MADQALTRSRTGRRFFSRPSLIAAAVIAIGAMALPPSGLGVEICMFKRGLGLPCFGCGLTRSVTCTAHGELDRALAYNPFGILVLLLAVGCLTVRFWPQRRQRRRFGIWLRRHDQLLSRISLWALIAFFGFGVIRTGLLVFDLWPGPTPW